MSYGIPQLCDGWHHLVQIEGRSSSLSSVGILLTMGVIGVWSVAGGRPQVLYYSILTKCLAVGLEDNTILFKGQSDFETDGVSHNYTAFLYLYVLFW